MDWCTYVRAQITLQFFFFFFLSQYAIHHADHLCAFMKIYQKNVYVGFVTNTDRQTN